MGQVGGDGAFTAFLTLLKAHLKPGETAYHLPLPLWLLLLLIAVSLVIIPRLWQVSSYLITVVHESGHAFAALSTFSSLQGIRINGDHSGDTRYMSSTFVPTRLWAGWWGYPFPLFAGVLGLWLATHGLSGLALTLAALGALIITLEIRNLVAFLTIGATTVVVLAAWWWLPQAWLTPLLLLASFFLLMGGLKSLGELFHHHLRGETEDSDARILAEEFFLLPMSFWLLTFLGAGGGSLYLTVLLLLPLFR